jgi:hypothetical protein
MDMVGIGGREISRGEFLQRAKERALAHLPHDPLEAMTSMMSDLGKHPELKNHVWLRIAPMFFGASHDEAAVRRWIEGFH